MALVEELADQLRELSRLKPSPRPVELEDVRPEDLAEALLELSPEEAALALGHLELELAAETLVEAPTQTVKQIVPLLEDRVLATYLDFLPMDDAIDLQEEIDEERWERLLGLIPKEDAAELRRLDQYPVGTVGRLMTEAYFWASPTATIESLLSDLRSAKQEKYESVMAVYVTAEDKTLLGIISIRRLLRAHPQMTAQEVMEDDVITVQADESDEEAARTMARYGFYALPVLDDRRRILGIFTGDDAQEILTDADTKDVLALGAVSGTVEAYLSLNVWQLYKRRMPWLLALFVAETLTGHVLRHYGQSDQSLAISPLMYFVPLLIGAGGNAGSQVTSTITRSLALGEIDPSDWFKVMSREWSVACLIGGTLGLVGSLRAIAPPPFGWAAGMEMSLLIALALPCIVLWANTVGSCLPILAKKLGLDPATLSAPFITTLVDATGLIIYFEIARRVIFPS